MASALRYSPLPALLPVLLLELLLVAGVPEAVDPSPAVVMSCGTQAASRVLRLMSVPPVSIERRFSMLGFMVGPPHRCSAWSPIYLHYARARAGNLSLLLPSRCVAVYLVERLRGLHFGGCFNQPTLTVMTQLKIPHIVILVIVLPTLPTTIRLNINRIRPITINTPEYFKIGWTTDVNPPYHQKYLNCIINF